MSDITNFQQWIPAGKFRKWKPWDASSITITYNINKLRKDQEAAAMFLDCATGRFETVMVANISDACFYHIDGLMKVIAVTVPELD